MERDPRHLTDFLAALLRSRIVTHMCAGVMRRFTPIVLYSSFGTPSDEYSRRLLCMFA